MMAMMVRGVETREPEEWGEKAGSTGGLACRLQRGLRLHLIGDASSLAIGLDNGNGSGVALGFERTG